MGPARPTRLYIGHTSFVLAVVTIFAELACSRSNVRMMLCACRFVFLQGYRRMSTAKRRRGLADDIRTDTPIRLVNEPSDPLQTSAFAVGVLQNFG